MTTHLRGFCPVLFLLAAACLAPGAAARDDRLARLALDLRSRGEADYEGGLDAGDLAVARALAQHALATGVPRKQCETKSYAATIASTHRRSNAGGRTSVNRVLDVLEDLVRNGNRKQRDIALVAIAEIGPGAGFSADFLQDRGAWSRGALSAVTCDRWSAPDVHEMWSPERARKVSALGYRERSALAVDLMIGQMLDKRLAWPDGVFSDALSNRGYGEHGLTEERIRKLLPVLTDATYPAGTRAQAIELVRALGRGSAVFEGPLLELYRTGGQALSAPAGAALVAIGSRHGGDVLADTIESERYRPWPRSWGRSRDCESPLRTDRLVQALMSRLDDPIPDVRTTAVQALGCLRETSAIPALLRALEQPFWTQQEAVLEALARMATLPPDASAAIQEIAIGHWSAVVRRAAGRALGMATEPEDKLRSGFHRTAVKHGLPICHGKEPGNGQYRLPWLGSFPVRWEDAKVHDIPSGFPIALREMRKRKGYGTNTFLRTEGGWLYSTDLWHYDGDFGYVSDAGKVQQFAPEAAHAAFIIRTQLGITVLGQDLFDGGEGGVLAVLERSADGTWSYRQILELPSEAFGHAFAPDGTLLVKDPYGAVAITKDRKLIPLGC